MFVVRDFYCFEELCFVFGVEVLVVCVEVVVFIVYNVKFVLVGNYKIVQCGEQVGLCFCCGVVCSGGGLVWCFYEVCLEWNMMVEGCGVFVVLGQYVGIG